jgi:branched-chain amino acid transport system ATP-binding protein
MDEPSEGLSPLIVQEVGSLIRELNAQGVSILLVEQNLTFALSVASRILIMNKGAIVYFGTPAEIEANPDITHNYLGMGMAAPRNAKRPTI